MELTGTQTALRELLAPEMTEMLEQRRTHEARESLGYLLSPEIAELIMLLKPAHRAVAFRLLSRAQMADVFTHIDPDGQEALLNDLTGEQLTNLINELEPDDRAELFEELPGKLVNKLMNLIRPEERRRTQVILGYPPESIGRIMTPAYLRLKAEWTLTRALDHIRQRGPNAETIETLYVTDDEGRLLHEIRLADLLFAAPQAQVASLAGSKFLALSARDDQEEAVRAMEVYDRPVLPVVDIDGVLVGIVTFDDVADVAEEEVTEDIQKMAAIEALEQPYLSISIVSLIRKRALWLGILFLGQLFTISAMASFENILNSAEILMLFVPLMISSGGNCGSQAASLIIRAEAIGEIELRDWWRVFRRELVCGLGLGLLLGFLGLMRVLGGHWLTPEVLGEHVVPFALAISTALVCIVLWGALVGSMLPLAFRALGVDPATSSAPFVTTIVDVTGILIYFYAAILMLRGSLLPEAAG